MRDPTDRSELNSVERTAYYVHKIKCWFELFHCMQQSDLTWKTQNGRVTSYCQLQDVSLRIMHMCKGRNGLYLAAVSTLSFWFRAIRNLFFFSLKIMLGCEARSGIHIIVALNCIFHQIYTYIPVRIHSSSQKEEKKWKTTFLEGFKELKINVNLKQHSHNYRDL